MLLNYKKNLLSKIIKNYFIILQEYIFYILNALEKDGKIFQNMIKNMIISLDI